MLTLPEPSIPRGNVEGRSVMELSPRFSIPIPETGVWTAVTASVRYSTWSTGAPPPAKPTAILEFDWATPGARVKINTTPLPESQSGWRTSSLNIDARFGVFWDMDDCPTTFQSAGTQSTNVFVRTRWVAFLSVDPNDDGWREASAQIRIVVDPDEVADTLN